MFVVKSPLRISLLGGGTDLKSYYQHYGSDIVAFTIDKFIYTNIFFIPKSFYDTKYRFSYSKTEEPININHISNDTIREFIRYNKIKEDLYISTYSELPHGNGLGSSSSFAASLFYAYNFYKKINITNDKLAKLVCDLEINKIKAPIGIQDQHACVYGGFNYFSFNKTGSVKVLDLSQKKSLIKKINERSLLILFERDSVDRKKILLEQQMKNKSNVNISYLNEMQLLAKEFLAKIDYKNNFEILCDLINRSWELKRNVSLNITNADLDNKIQFLRDNGCISSKLLGAGGKGFILSLFQNIKDRNEFYKKFHKKFKMTNFKIYSKAQTITTC